MRERYYHLSRLDSLSPAAPMCTASPHRGHPSRFVQSGGERSSSARCRFLLPSVGAIA
jgi:hypothetical protein